MEEKEETNNLKTIIITNKGGRPTEGLDSLPMGWQDHIITMYSNGAADCEIQATIYQWRGSFSKSLWRRWIAQEEEFKEVIEVGKIISEAWWSKIGRESLKDQKFQVVNYIWQTRNRFGWNDKGEHKELEEEKSEIDYSKLSMEALKEIVRAKK